MRHSLPEERDLRLRDGRTVSFRPVRPDDGEMFHGFFSGLSAQSRDFMHGWSGLHSREHGESLALKVRCSDHYAVIAVPAGTAERIAGYCWLDGVHTADMPMLGIGIVDEFHEVGLGRLLLRTMIDHARRLGWPRLRLGVWADNARALHVYRSVGFQEDPSKPPRDFNGRTELYLVVETGVPGAPAPREFPLIQLAGTPYAVGKQYGMVARSLIARSMATVRGLLPVSIDQATGYAARSIPYCQEKTPELVEEVRGIADGAGLALEEVFTLNASLDLIMSAWKLKAAAAPDCWTLAASGEATDGGRTFVTWTAEDSAKWFDSCVLLAIEPSTGPAALMWTFAGFVGRPGLGPHLGLSAACHPAEDCGHGLPYPFVCRKALECRSAAEAVQAIGGYARMSGMWYNLGDDQGGLATLRTSARAIHVEDHQPGWTACAGRWPEERVPRVRDLLRRHWGRNALPEIRQILCDHGPGNLCPHDDSWLVSLATFVCDVNAQSLWVAYGSACENEHVRYMLGTRGGAAAQADNGTGNQPTFGRTHH
jgi:isopenicillin-N N-acyltransferase-like protein